VQAVALIVPPHVLKELAAAPRDIAKRLWDRLERIAANPFGPKPGVKPVSGEPGSFRVRQGDWPAIYSVEDGDVFVERVGDRKGVYR
jgi:mRNA-degrading endonuclease RelE of RelBE toxin-antitoxin system